MRHRAGSGRLTPDAAALAPLDVSADLHARAKHRPYRPVERPAPGARAQPADGGAGTRSAETAGGSASSSASAPTGAANWLS